MRGPDPRATNPGLRQKTTSQTTSRRLHPASKGRVGRRNRNHRTAPQRHAPHPAQEVVRTHLKSPGSSISRRSSVPLSQALARWKPGIDDTKAGKQRSSVAFKFGQRLGDDTTAHETGIFHYVSVDSKGERQDDYLHFEGLLLKRTDGKWSWNIKKPQPP